MRIAVSLLAGTVLLAGCRDERITWDAMNDKADGASWTASRADNTPSAEVKKEFAALHRVAAKFQSLERAKAAGWSTEITGCMTG